MDNIQQQQISQADNKLKYHVVKGFDRWCFRGDSPESLSMTHRLSPPRLALPLESSEPAAAQNFDMIIICCGRYRSVIIIISEVLWCR